MPWQNSLCFDSTRLFCIFARHKNGIIVEIVSMPERRNNRFGIIEADENQ